MWGTTCSHALHDGTEKYFNSRAPCGARLHPSRSRRLKTNFNSRAPCGARQETRPFSIKLRRFQLPCPVWGTTVTLCPFFGFQCISTPVPRVGHDDRGRALHLRPPNFNSRAPCGARRGNSCSKRLECRFQLPCPVWGTTYPPRSLDCTPCISTPVPRVGHDFS